MYYYASMYVAMYHPGLFHPLSLRLKGTHTSSTFDHVTTYAKQQDIVGEILFQNIVWKNTNTMKHKKYHTDGTFLKYSLAL
jgi:hypothetical protein